MFLFSNELPLNRSAKKSLENIVTLAESVKTEYNKVIVSTIVCCEYSFR